MTDNILDSVSACNSLPSSGSGFGSFCLPILIQYLLDEVGLRGEMIIVSGLTTHFLVAAFCFGPHKVRWHGKCYLAFNPMHHQRAALP